MPDELKLGHSSSHMVVPKRSPSGMKGIDNLNLDILSHQDIKHMQSQLDEFSDSSSDLSEELFRDVDVLSSSEDSEIDEVLEYQRALTGADSLSQQPYRLASFNHPSRR